MERSLHKQQEFARRLVDSFPDLILVLDAEARYTSVSPRCHEVLGYELDETQQDAGLAAALHPEDLSKLMALFNAMLTRNAELCLDGGSRSTQIGGMAQDSFQFQPAIR